VLAELEKSLRLDMSRAVDRGSFGTDQAAIHLFSAPTVDGRSCFVVEKALDPGATCLTTELFASRPVEYIVQSDGGPETRGLQYEFVSGITTPGVDAVAIQYSSGETDVVHVTPMHSFLYRTPPARLRAGDRPETLIVRQGNDVLGTFPLSQ
jgi:hypothetical protein